MVHRQNAELETLNADIQTEKEQLLQQNTHLTERLEAVAKSPTPGQGINADTPLDLMLNMLQRMIMVTFPSSCNTKPHECTIGVVNACHNAVAHVPTKAHVHACNICRSASTSLTLPGCSSGMTAAVPTCAGGDGWHGTDPGSAAHTDRVHNRPAAAHWVGEAAAGKQSLYR